MAKRKTAKHRPPVRAERSAAARGGRRTTAKSSSVKGSAVRAKRARGRRKVLDLRDVTAEVQRRHDREEAGVPTPPSTLDLDRRASAARSGRAGMLQRQSRHTAASPAITAGDVDANWEEAYSAGDEAATGDNPTPDQATVEDVGRAAGVDYEDTEELKSTPKIDKRDKKRWELDPASAEDYRERNKKRGS